MANSSTKLRVSSAGPSTSAVRVWKIVGQVLIYVSGFALLAAAVKKFAHLTPVVAQLTNSGFGGEKITLVASLEVVSSLLLLFPITRSIGLLFTSAFLGGAIATHVQAGEYLGAFAPSFLLFICWLGTWLRYPEVLWSVTRRE